MHIERIAGTPRLSGAVLHGDLIYLSGQVPDDRRRAEAFDGPGIRFERTQAFATSDAHRVGGDTLTGTFALPSPHRAA